jgi:hypothetical protein
MKRFRRRAQERGPAMVRGARCFGEKKKDVDGMREGGREECGGVLYTLPPLLR